MSSVSDPTAPAALEVRDLVAGYGDITVVDGVSVVVPPGKVVVVAGPNGAGKSTLLKALLGIARVMSGRVFLEGKDVTGVALEKLARLGIGYVPQLDDVFDSLKVQENLEMGGYMLNRGERERRIEQVLQVFPPLQSKLHRYAETLSGGERKMTAIARVLMLDPKVLVLDEPTASLTPEMSRLVLHEQVRPLSRLGKSVLLVEQKAVAALEVSDWAYLLVRGQVAVSAPAAQVLEDPNMREIFLGRSAIPAPAATSPAP
ncbi:MAG TPA: ATP-binding cassette domain-containing protein [Candidatus Dormibacteraeota bacterium]|nr:ATP-binding cassette domain-containing protein [Candidatus Dormibacteraeota bacterium]